MRRDWILLTAGLGGAQMRSAALRVAKDAACFDIFSRIIVLTDDNLGELCPSVSFKYKNILHSRTRGFGYMCWKAEIVFRTLSENQGECGVVWIDAGCEVIPSIISRLKMVHYLKEAEKDGYLYFTLDTKESHYTKRELFNEFPSLDIHDSSPQAQTTFFALAGPVGLSIASRWFEVVTNCELNINEEYYLQQPSSFVEHRHDQSVFSLVLKESGYVSNMQPLRNGRGKRLSRILTFILDPVIASRNRTGDSIYPNFVKNLGKFTLRAYRKL